MARIDASKLDLQEKVVHIGRVSKTVKGGRIYKFAALVVVGDGNGTIGFGIGKAGEVPDAIRKGIEDAKKNMVKVSLKGTTIPHEIIGKFGAGEILMKPAPPGYRRNCWRRCACRTGGCRYQRYPYQVPAFQQPLQCCYRYLRGSEGPAHRRGSCGGPWQGRKRNSGLRR